MSLSRLAEGKLSTGYDDVIGIDEAGRGPLAGPVVAAACFIKTGVNIEGVNDSKRTTEADREEIYHVLTNHSAVKWTVAIVSHTEIDEVNILQATMNGMRRCTNELLDNNKSLFTNRNKVLALVDGNRIPSAMPIEAVSVVKGDSIVFSIAAASIIAKVTRDRIMLALDKQYPVYNLAKHKGYPTSEHRSLLMHHGACEVHRRSYAPVRLALEKFGSTSGTVDSKNIPTAAELVISPATALESATNRVKQQRNRNNCTKLKRSVWDDVCNSTMPSKNAKCSDLKRERTATSKEISCTGTDNLKDVTAAKRCNTKAKKIKTPSEKTMGTSTTEHSAKLVNKMRKSTSRSTTPLQKLSTPDQELAGTSLRRSIRLRTNT